MRLFGFDIRRAPRNRQTLSPPSGTWHKILDIYPGAWQQDNTPEPEVVTGYWAVFACATLIAGDIAKCPAVVMKRTIEGFWEETIERPVLRKPNQYQTSIEFFFSWVMSKLLTGNTYVLKVRDREKRIVAMHVLDPLKCKPLVSESADVFYELGGDNLAGIGDKSIIVPASEIIHDKMYPLYHPLVGVSPIHACGRAAAQGLAIQKNSQAFFENMSRPGGMLTAPGKISDEVAARLKKQFEENYGGKNIGRLAVAGDNLTYQSFSVTAEDAQLIDQLKMTAEMVCACFHVPGYKIGVGAMPTVNNTAALNQQYYDQCLQFIIETMEYQLDYGLELDTPNGFIQTEPRQVWFDLDNLLRMDPESRYKSHSEAIGGGWLAPNEARLKENLPSVDGGDSPMIQQQNYSLAALAKRDAQDDPFSTGGGQTPSEDPQEEVRAFLNRFTKGLAHENA